MADIPAKNGHSSSDRREVVLHNLTQANFSHHDFHRAELIDWVGSGVSFAQASLKDTLFVKAVLSGCNFNHTMFDNAVFVDSQIRDSVFYAALLMGVTFKNCVLMDVDFRGAMFRGCYFEGCQIIGCTFSEALILDNELDMDWAVLRAGNVFLK